MRFSVFKADPCKSERLIEAARGHTITLVAAPLNASTASLAAGADVVCSVGDSRLDAEVLRAIAAAGAKVVLCDSPDNEIVDVATAAQLGVAVIDVSDIAPRLADETCTTIAHAINRVLRGAGTRLILQREQLGMRRHRTIPTANSAPAGLLLSPGTGLGGLAGD